MVSPLQRKLQPIKPSGGNIRNDLYQRGLYDPSGDGMYANRQPMQTMAAGAINPAARTGMMVNAQSQSPAMMQSQMVGANQNYNDDGGTGFHPGMQVNQATPQAQQQASPMFSAPQYGLSGTEQALTTGLYGGLDYLRQGYGAAMNQLGGANSALQAASQGIRGDINSGMNLLGQTSQNINNNVNASLGMLNQASQGVRGDVNAGLGLLGQAGRQGSNAISGATGQGLNMLNQAGAQAGGMIGQGVNALSGNFGARADQVDPNTGQPFFRQAAGGVGQFSGAGLAAQQQQAALSGAMGREAQQQAFDNYVESPEQAFLREQGEQSVINQASATGGLSGGNVLKELQRFGTGLAAQDYQNSFNRLGQLSGQGLQAAGQQGQFLSQAGQQQGQLAGQNAQLGTQANIASASNRLNAAGQQAQLYGQGANINAQLGQAGAGMAQQGGLSIANLLQSAAGQGANLIGQGAGLQSNLAGQGANAIGQGSSLQSNLAGQGANLIGQGAGLQGQLAGQQSQLGQYAAGLGMQGGQSAANMFGQAGTNIANARTRAGEQIAGNVQSTSGALANLQNAQGLNLSQLLGGNISSIADLYRQQGLANSGADFNLAQLLANLTTGQGGQLADLQARIGAANAAGTVGQANAISGGISNLLGIGADAGWFG